MAEKIKVENFNFDRLVIERFLQDEIVEIEDGQSLENGDVLVQDNGTGKYTKYVTETHGQNLHVTNLRVYTGDDIKNTSDYKGTALRQGKVNIKKVKNMPSDVAKYALINQLEKHNIFIEEEK
ncbi:hypothetical protein [Streptobacillus moniliformis]|uniref:hypothetical protein n=1 Tax=Streptobacillus moniliformis TaxID=34105 RepID=UPI0007E45ECF|nr:hypothetical protein [Streptobacillus moniliformis]